MNAAAAPTHNSVVKRAGAAGGWKFAARIIVAISLLASGAFAQTTIPETDPPLRPIQNMFEPLSTPALKIHETSIPVLLICAAIFCVVTTLLVFIVWKFRQRNEEDRHVEPPQVYGSSHIELAWTVIPIIITVVLILITARTIGEIQNAKIPDDALRIRVIGHQWWWEVHYLKQNENGEWVTDFIAANEIHVPVGTREEPKMTHMILESSDVIHSFWVPQLAGKTDLVPNRKNELWIEPWATGTYLGNCAEYCGTQHAKMKIRVIVEEQDVYEAWAQNQRTPPPPPPANVALGHKLFMDYACANCHTVDGTIADGVFGPDLTKLMTRRTLGSGAVDNTPENLFKWVRDPQAADMKPGCLMPDMKMLDSEVREIVAYLETLK